ncbi:MAG: hypothetical protein HY071_00575 [Chloroflexi bacterium]|nr:hypothetical protein [Chloroflexota bacterium]
MRIVGLAAVFISVVLAIASAPSLAAQVDCSDPQVRSAIQTAQNAWAQTIAQYRQLPPAYQQQLDQQVRQATGYTLPQLAQLIVDCGGARPSTPRPTARPATAPPAGVTARPPTAPPAPTPRPTLRVFLPSQYQFRLQPFVLRTLSPSRYLRPPTPRPEPAIQRARGGPLADVTLPPVPAGRVPVGSGELKLCWQLFSRTDCTDQQAVDAYRQRAEPIIDRLKAQQQATDVERAQYERRGQLFEDAVKSQSIARLTSDLRDDHAYFMKERNDAATDVVASLLGAAPSQPLNDVSAASMYLRDAPKFAATLGRKVASGERWSAGDVEDAANLAASLSIDLTTRALEGTRYAASATAVGRGVAGGQAAIKLA